MRRRNLRALFRLLDEHPRVARVIETADRLEVHLVSDVLPTVTVSSKPNATPEPDEPTPDEWLRRQYEKPDGT